MEPRLRVAIDATSSLGSRTGIGHVTGALIEHLATRGDLDLHAFAVTWRGRAALGDELPGSVRAATRRFPARLTRVLWPRVAWPRVERWTGPVDVVHATNYVAPPARAPTLLTVADLTYLRFPELCAGDVLRYPRLVQVAIDRGATIHTYSEFVAGEIRDRYGLPLERVVVIPPGLGARPAGDPVRGRQLAGSDRYVLAVGTVEPRKNLPVLVGAFRAAVEQARHSDRVHRMGWLDDASRDDLLAGATVLAYPSVYEGFGLPPLEAMQVGVPVVASSAGSLPEVLGDAALLPDPTDVDAVANTLARVLVDDPARRELIDRGRSRVCRYQWERSVGRFVDTYRRVAGR